MIVAFVEFAFPALLLVRRVALNTSGEVPHQNEGVSSLHLQYEKLMKKFYSKKVLLRSV